MNPANPTVYFVREVPWDSVYPISTRMLAGEFAADGWNVVWLNPPSMLWHAIRRRSLHYPDRKGRWVNDNVFAMTPTTVIPFSKHFPLDRPSLVEATWRGCWPPFRRSVADRGVASPDLLFISHWSAFGLRHLYPRVPILYHVTDKYEGMSSVPATFRKIHTANLDCADHVVVTAPALKRWLVDEYACADSRVTIVTHGVLFERFQGTFEEPELMRAIPHPRLVSVGNTTKLPIDGLRRLAEALPAAQIVLIGPRNEPVDRLATDRSNIHALGPMRAEEIPAYLAASDVGIVAFGGQVDNYVEGICPMKLFEYAAAGLPSVCTPLPVYNALDVPVWIAPIGNAFVDSVRAALIASPDVRARMRAFALRNTWRRKYEEILPIVRSLRTPGVAHVVG